MMIRLREEKINGKVSEKYERKVNEEWLMVSLEVNGVSGVFRIT